MPGLFDAAKKHPYITSFIIFISGIILLVIHEYNNGRWQNFWIEDQGTDDINIAIFWMGLIMLGFGVLWFLIYGIFKRQKE